MAIVGFAVAFSVAKVYSIKHDYAIDGNQVCKKGVKATVLGLIRICMTLPFYCLTWL